MLVLAGDIGGTSAQVLPSLNRRAGPVFSWRRRCCLLLTCIVISCSNRIEKSRVDHSVKPRPKDG